MSPEEDNKYLVNEVNMLFGRLGIYFGFFIEVYNHLKDDPRFSGLVKQTEEQDHKLKEAYKEIDKQNQAYFESVTGNGNG